MPTPPSAVMLRYRRELARAMAGLRAEVWYREPRNADDHHTVFVVVRSVELDDERANEVITRVAAPPGTRWCFTVTDADGLFLTDETAGAVRLCASCGRAQAYCRLCEQIARAVGAGDHQVYRWAAFCPHCEVNACQVQGPAGRA